MKTTKVFITPWISVSVTMSPLATWATSWPITASTSSRVIDCTKPVDTATGSIPANYQVTTFTHKYHAAYGGPEIEPAAPAVKSVALSEDGMVATITLETLTQGHVHAFDLGTLRSRDREELLHRHAYYTVNEIPTR